MPLILDTVTPEQVRRLKDRVAAQTGDAIERGRQNWERTTRVMRRLIDGGVRIALGSDAGGMSGDQFIGWTAHTEIENMVAAGMTPAQALIACTRVSADVHGLSDMGTWQSARARTSSCSTEIRSPISPTRGRSRASFCEVRKSIARR